jgi:hypothetical protein
LLAGFKNKSTGIRQDWGVQLPYHHTWLSIENNKPLMSVHDTSHIQAAGGLLFNLLPL